MTKEELVQFLTDVFNEHGKIDYKYLISNYEWNYKCILKEFGSLNNAVKEAKINQNIWKKVTKDECKNEIIRIYKEYGCVNSKILKEHGLISLETINRKCGTLYSILVELNIPSSPKQHRNVTKDMLDEEVQNIIKKYGYVSKPLMEKHSIYGPKIVNRIYGGFKKMYDAIGIEGHPSGRIPTDENLLNEFIDIYNRYGTISQDIIEKESQYSITCYKDRFGCINNIRKIFNIKEIKNDSQSAVYTFKKFSDFINEKPATEKTFDWLINPITGCHLFIDAFFEKHMLAVEYNGPQHYKLDGIYTRTEDKLIYRQLLDKIKIDILREHGIRTISVHYKDIVNEEYLCSIFQ